MKNNFAIAAGHKATAEAAAEVLRAGGNAIDAAIAAFFMTWVVEPCMSSGGGGGFAHVYSSSKRTAYFYDFFCQTPKSKSTHNEVDFYPIEVDFGDTKEEFQIGRGSTGVPGAIAGAFALHHSFGTVPMRDLIQPARHIALEGVQVNSFQQMDFRLLEPILKSEKRGQELFFKDNRLIRVGETMTMSGLADYLEYLASEGKNAFYEGEVAQKIVNDYQDKGGFLRREDFTNYQAVVRESLTFSYRDFQVLTNPQPAFGGLLIRKSMQLMEQKNFADPAFSFEHLKDLYRIFKETEQYSKNPDLLFKSDKGMISPTKRGNTTHFSIVDNQGNAVALTASNGEGCGYFVENTDIQLNNMLGEAALLPAGFHSWTPDTRLPSMMSPTLILDKNEKLIGVTGSSGAGRIAPAISQSLHYTLDKKLPVRASVNAPRLHVAHGELNVEPGWSNVPAQANFPDRLNLWKEPSLFFGGVNAVFLEKEKWNAGSDDRREGSTIVV